MELGEMLNKLAVDNKIIEFNLHTLFQRTYEPADISEPRILRPSDLDNLDEHIREMTKPYVAQCFTCLSSKVKLSGNKKSQLFLLDFTCSANEDNQRLVEDYVERIGHPKGFLLNSGKSYHFYSGRVLDKKEWESSLRSLVSPLIDLRWRDLQLKRGFSFLRVSDMNGYRPVPEVVKAIGY